MPLAVCRMNHDHSIETRVSLQLDTDYRFRVRFHHGRMPDIFTDEPPPLGSGENPGPKELLGAAIGSCLATSLLFCMQKARLDVRDLEVEITVETGRNPEGRLRVQRVDVQLSPSVTPEVRKRMASCAEVFESFCTVTESVRHGFPVRVDLAPREVASSPSLEERQ